MTPKAVALIAAACLTTGWLLASVLVPPVARLQVLPEQRPARPATADPPTPYFDRLQLRLDHAPPPPVPGRNPFVFGTRRDPNADPDAATMPGGWTEVPPSDPGAIADAEMAGPRYSLSGIGTSDTPAGEVRTAVLSDGTTVHLVKTGEVIGDYRVTEITDTTATLAGPSGSKYILRLKN